MRERIIWGTVGVASGLLLRVAGEYIISEADWPQNVKGIALDFIQHPLAWVLSGFVGGLFLGNIPNASADRTPWYETLGEDPIRMKRR